MANLSRPGGNVTGLSLQDAELAGKRIELLRQIVPNLRRLAILFDAAIAGACESWTMSRLRRATLASTSRHMGSTEQRKSNLCSLLSKVKQTRFMSLKTFC